MKLTIAFLVCALGFACAEGTLLEELEVLLDKKGNCQELGTNCIMGDNCCSKICNKQFGENSRTCKKTNKRSDLEERAAPGERGASCDNDDDCNGSLKCARGKGYQGADVCDYSKKRLLERLLEVLAQDE